MDTHKTWGCTCTGGELSVEIPTAAATAVASSFRTPKWGSILYVAVVGDGLWNRLILGQDMDRWGQKRGHIKIPIHRPRGGNCVFPAAWTMRAVCLMKKEHVGYQMESSMKLDHSVCCLCYEY